MTVSEMLTLLGYPHEMYDGRCVWTDKEPHKDVLELCKQLGGGLFLREDLGADRCKGLDEECGADALARLQAAQCSEIRALRAAAYRAEADDLFFEAAADDLQDQSKRKGWIAKRDEIKKRYPWPGEYR